eukprot:2633576-Pleurochrysis_carterae.AAC.2
MSLDAAVRRRRATSCIGVAVRVTTAAEAKMRRRSSLAPSLGVINLRKSLRAAVPALPEKGALSTNPAPDPRSVNLRSLQTSCTVVRLGSH